MSYRLTVLYFSRVEKALIVMLKGDMCKIPIKISMNKGGLWLRGSLSGHQAFDRDLPPSSMVTSLRLEAAALAMTFLPVATPPVNEIF
jgi:hypothetical protein